MDISEDMPETVRSIAEAEQTGADVAIPMSEFATFIAPSDRFNDLIPDLKFAVDDLTQREAQAQQRENEQFYDEMKARHDSTEGSDNRVYDDMKAQLEAAGQSPNVADYQAQVWSAWFNTQGERTGKDAYEMYQEFNASVKHEDLRATHRKGVDRMSTTLDMMRKGNRPTQKDVFGDTFGEMIAKRGGIQDSGGELKARDYDRRQPGKTLFGNRKISQEDGMTFDEAIAVGIEEGFFPESAWGKWTSEEVLEHLDAEVNGDPVYRDSADEAALSLQEDMDYLDETFAKMGVDLDTMTNEQIMDLMDDSTYYQSSYSELTGNDKKVVDEALEDVDDGAAFERWVQDTRI